MAEKWDGIHVVSKETTIPETGAETGIQYVLRYVIDEQGLDDAIGLEYVVLHTDNDGTNHIYSVHPFKKIGKNGNLYTFECKIEPDDAGTFKTAVRMYPKNEKLPHRQDFCYVKWLD